MGQYELLWCDPVKQAVLLVGWRDPHIECERRLGAIHPKAMLVILTKPDEWETWLSADWATTIIISNIINNLLIALTV